MIGRYGLSRLSLTQCVLTYVVEYRYREDYFGFSKEGKKFGYIRDTCLIYHPA